MLGENIKVKFTVKFHNAMQKDGDGDLKWNESKGKTRSGAVQCEISCVQTKCNMFVLVSTTSQMMHCG